MKRKTQLVVYIPQLMLEMTKALAKSRGISTSKLVRNLLVDEFFKEGNRNSFRFQ